MWNFIQENQYIGKQIFIDSDRLEAMIDHFLINNQYTKAKICAELAITQFSYNL